MMFIYEKYWGVLNLILRVPLVPLGFVPMEPSYLNYKFRKKNCSSSSSISQEDIENSPFGVYSLK